MCVCYLSDHPSHEVACINIRLKSEAQRDIRGAYWAFPEENIHFIVAAPQAALDAEHDMVKSRVEPWTNSRALNPQVHLQNIVLVVPDANCSRVLLFVLSHKNHPNFFRHDTKITQRFV